jgi:hypothetical protein
MILKEIRLNLRVNRIWLERLFGLLHPTLHTTGNLLCISSTIPHFERATPIIRTWIEAQSYDLAPGYYPDEKFLSVILSTAVLASAFDRNDASHYFLSSPCHLIKLPFLLAAPSGAPASQYAATFLLSNKPWAFRHGIEFAR